MSEDIVDRIDRDLDEYDAAGLPDLLEEIKRTDDPVADELRPPRTVHREPNRPMYRTGPELEREYAADVQLEPDPHRGWLRRWVNRIRGGGRG